ncbi:MAG: hypothetical protein IH939_00990 [Acidobacteria bacterium]|nr:hypothetical protein [Acidobacteriota bacterium]
MVSIEWVILCKNVQEDVDGLLCIDGIIDTFTVPEVPISGHGTIVFRLRGNPNQEVELRIELRGPTGTWLAEIPPATMTINENGLAVNSVAARLPFAQPGRYELRVFANEQTCVLPFTVELSSPTVVH